MRQAKVVMVAAAAIREATMEPITGMAVALAVPSVVTLVGALLARLPPEVWRNGDRRGANGGVVVADGGTVSCDGGGACGH